MALPVQVEGVLGRDAVGAAHAGAARRQAVLAGAGGAHCRGAEHTISESITSISPTVTSQGSDEHLNASIIQFRVCCVDVTHRFTHETYKHFKLRYLQKTILNREKKRKKPIDDRLWMIIPAE